VSHDPKHKLVVKAMDGRYVRSVYASQFSEEVIYTTDRSEAFWFVDAYRNDALALRDLSDFIAGYGHKVFRVKW
jgi:hypothetical protein